MERIIQKSNQYHTDFQVNLPPFVHISYEQLMLLKDSWSKMDNNPLPISHKVSPLEKYILIIISTCTPCSIINLCFTCT